MASIIRLIVLASVIGNVAAELSCKDMDGKDVDWFIALKMPKKDGYESVHPDIATGLAFYYADSNNPEFRISKANINDHKSALGYTVSQAIEAYEKKSKDILYAFYNDQAPGIHVGGKKTEKRNYDNRAHAKGVISFNEKQGFWLLHSAPRFSDPTSGKGYFYPDNAAVKGQSFMCATFMSDQLEEISNQIVYSHFSYYVTNLPESIANKYPRLRVSMERDDTVDDPSEYHRTVTLKTKGGQILDNFEKNKNSQGDLWANQVAAKKNQSFFVETWLNGARDWQNVCKGNIFTKNIRAIKHELGGVKWSSSSDHSKWAVSDQPKTVCIGDINRQLSQNKRGGGCLCIDNEKVWKFFRNSIDVVECCSGIDGLKENCGAMPCDSFEVPTGYRGVEEKEREWVIPDKYPDTPFCEPKDDEKPASKKKPAAKKPAAKKSAAKTKSA